ncbi:esterase family protein [Robertmurraya kyonggiensis]|uniref:Esterase family protein n=1 Tax=Robertmurraya kyonggiensis TaxID=1037680 RepID=A0A4V5P1L7_9BACI|nr:esterase family protein [Robertmurraya kyonggiensis]TKC18320.1 esterase family protein [Robertmurraya kyonggiensis]
MIATKGKITEHFFESKELKETIQLLIYLPESFSPLYKYSLLIAQDGRDYFQLGRIGRVADELMKDGEIENLIIIGIPYKDVQDRRKKYHPDGEQNAAYIRFLAKELVPFLDEQFPSYQMGMGRALIGDSLGATVSLMAALQFPHTFGKVILQSPYVNDEIIEAVVDFTQPHLLSLYHIIGKEETEVKTTSNIMEDFLTPNRELNIVIESKAFPYFYDEFEGNHTWTYWQPDIKRALRRMFSI